LAQGVSVQDQCSFEILGTKPGGSLKFRGFGGEFISGGAMSQTDGAENPRPDDVERQGVVASSSSVEQYGTVPRPEPNKDPPVLLLFGMYPVSPQLLIRSLVAVYALIFAVMTWADVMYYITVDGRFPKGLNHLYPSEAERKATVDYTRQTLLCMRLHALATFIAVMCLLYFQIFAKADNWLRLTTVYLKEKLESYWNGACCWPCRKLVEVLSGLLCCLLIPVKWLCSLLARSCDCCCSRVQWLFSEHKWRDLLHGSVYLALFATFFFLIAAPFMYWKLWIDLDFGFANALTVTESGFKQQLVAQFFSTLVWGIPGKFLFLAVLQFRFGWLAMWTGMMLGMIWAQYNMASLAPIALGMNNVFPVGAFGVGRGFSLGTTGIKESPWISLNRIFFPYGAQSGQNLWVTNDKHKGRLAVRFNEGLHAWTIAGSPQGKVYAKTDGSADMNLESLNGKTWTEVDGGGSGQLGTRSGERLREKVIAFAKQQKVDIKEIFMVDGSHLDARANAFVGGMDGSIIGLYDTLFLGDHPKIYQSSDSQNGFLFMLNGKSAIRTLTETVQSVDTSDEDNHEEWSSAPTQAMSDDEIVAILAHELAHVAEHHMEQTMAVQATTA
jgi:Zn-dependent protease with chaperone function